MVRGRFLILLSVFSLFLFWGVFSQPALSQSSEFKKIERNISLGRVAIQFSKDIPEEKIKFFFSKDLTWLEDFSETFIITGLNIVVANLRVPASNTAELENHYSLLKILPGFEAYLPVLKSGTEQVIV